MTTEEKINKAKGAVKEGLGKLVGDKHLEKEGATEKAAAKLKDVVGDVKDVVEDVKGAVEGTIDGIKNVVNKEKK
ncbi:CsbD family protein [Peptostreptococcus stomatis]|uniref:CsbD family protein n=1 Tax=Peptostreptococcus stomatis TaxID=341694 RepID=UPI0026F2C324|nr:CsbD family protein [Peptostreptococcus stomatis]